MSETSYASLSDVKAWLGITGTTDDALLTSLIANASSFVDSYVGRPGGLTVSSYTDVRNGNGKMAMTLINGPTVAVQAVVVSGRPFLPLAAPGVGVSPVGPAFTYDENAVYLWGADFTRGLKNVSVTYTAGYDPVPLDVVQGVIDLVSLKYMQRTRIGKTSEALTGIGTVSYLVRDLPPDFKIALDNIKRVSYATEL